MKFEIKRSWRDANEEEIPLLTMSRGLLFAALLPRRLYKGGPLLNEVEA